MNQPSKNSTCPPFRPTVAGCVGRDPRLFGMLEECCAAALYAFSANTYRSLLCESSSPALSTLFEELAMGAAEQLRAFGRLTFAVGGNPAPRCQLRVLPHALPSADPNRLCREAISDEKNLIDRCQTLMGRTQDRVVRSFLAAILSDLQRQVERLAHVAAE